MLERVWRKGNALALLVGMQTDTATMEDSMEIPLKTRTKSTIWPSNPTAEDTPRLVLVTQSCPTLCDPVHCSLQGSSVHGIL